MCNRPLQFTCFELQLIQKSTISSHMFFCSNMWLESPFLETTSPAFWYHFDGTQSLSPWPHLRRSPRRPPFLQVSPLGRPPWRRPASRSEGAPNSRSDPFFDGKNHLFDGGLIAEKIICIRISLYIYIYTLMGSSNAEIPELDGGVDGKFVELTG